MDILAALASSRSLKLTLVLGALAALAGCGKPDEAGAHGGGPPAVSVAPAVKRDVQEFDEFTARLEAPDTVDIRSRVAGTLVQVRFREGSWSTRVIRCSPLIRVHSPPRPRGPRRNWPPHVPRAS